MEGVGARLGRSSTRYGPATVFTGPVRKWKKKWIHVSPSNNKDTTTNHSHNNLHSSNATSNGLSNGINGSHLLLYKWTPLTPSQNNSNGGGDKNYADDDAAAATPPPEDCPKRKFKYVPIAVLEEWKREDEENETTENVENEAKESEGDPGVAVPTSKKDGYDEKPDINDIPMEESQEDKRVIRQDLNESTLDLSLG